MSVSVIQAIGLDDAWHQCLREALDHGRIYTIDSGSFAGQQRKEIPFVVVHIKSPGIRPLAPTVPPGVPSPATDDNIQQYMSYLMTDDVQPNEQYTYGEDLAPQIEEVIRRYKTDGYDTNQCCMSVGSRQSLWLADPQCCRVLDTRIQDNTLHFMLYFRSWDLWGGFPTNLGGLQMLKEYMAEAIGVKDGDIIATSKGLHIYDHAWDLARMVLKEL